MGQMEQQWEHVQDRLRGEIGDAAFRNWLQPIRVVEAHDDAVCLGVPTRFIRDWVVTHYAARIREVWAEVQGAPMEVSFVVQPVRRGASGLAEPDPAAAPEVIAVAPEPAPPVDDAMAAPLDRRFTFDSFVVGKPT